MKIPIHHEKEVRELLEKNGHKPYRYDQLIHALYKDNISDYDQITTLPKDLIQLLKEHTDLWTLKIDDQSTSSDDQTTKFLFETHDGERIESVIMRHKGGRNTLCISSQVGCAMACVFCATGKLGFTRNLSGHEIVEQIMVARKQLATEGKVLRNIVFMGMGEPMLNWPGMEIALEVMTNQKKLNISSRRITVSTCGIVPSIRKMGEKFPQVSLAISLHAPNDEARAKIMPVNMRYPVKELMSAIDDYVKETNKRIFYEYIMIAGYTDRLEYAYELADLMKDRLAHVNFIPYNPGLGSGGKVLEKSSPYIIHKFQKVLEEKGIPSTIRYTMGDDIDAACGQLALKKKESQEVSQK